MYSQVGIWVNAAIEASTVPWTASWLFCEPLCFQNEPHYTVLLLCKLSWVREPPAFLFFTFRKGIVLVGVQDIYSEKVLRVQKMTLTWKP